MSTKEPLFVALRGLAMGIAEVIPGVSGGTIAFITGIYERLLNAIKGIDLEFFRLLLRFKLPAAFKKIDGLFLLSLLTGMVIGLLLGVFGVTHLLETNPELLWAFFFGLILASVWVIGRLVKKWSPPVILIFILGFSVAFFITWMSPAEGCENLLYVFFCGALAICALILPGISGSFILLLLGMYTTVIPAVKDFLVEGDVSSLVLLLVFGLGCIFGLLSFVRVMSWLFSNYHNPTLALLTGFMLGSLAKIWPWRNPVAWMDGEGGIVSALPEGARAEEFKLVSESPVFPTEYFTDPQIPGVIVSFCLGMAVVILITRLTGPGVKSETA